MGARAGGVSTALPFLKRAAEFIPQLIDARGLPLQNLAALYSAQFNVQPALFYDSFYQELGQVVYRQRDSQTRPQAAESLTHFTPTGIIEYAQRSSDSESNLFLDPVVRFVIAQGGLAPEDMLAEVPAEMQEKAWLLPKLVMEGGKTFESLTQVYARKQQSPYQSSEFIELFLTGLDMSTPARYYNAGDALVYDILEGGGILPAALPDIKVLQDKAHSIPNFVSQNGLSINGIVKLLARLYPDLSYSRPDVLAWLRFAIASYDPDAAAGPFDDSDSSLW